MLAYLRRAVPPPIVAGDRRRRPRAGGGARRQHRRHEVARGDAPVGGAHRAGADRRPGRGRARDHERADAADADLGAEAPARSGRVFGQRRLLRLPASPRAAGRVAVTASSVPREHLPRLDRHRQPVVRRRQRAGRVRRERARRRVGPVEVEDDLTVTGGSAYRNRPRAVAGLARRRVTEDEEQLGLARLQHGIEPQRLARRARDVNDAYPGLGMLSAIPSTVGTSSVTGFACGTNVATTR